MACAAPRQRPSLKGGGSGQPRADLGALSLGAAALLVGVFFAACLAAFVAAGAARFLAAAFFAGRLAVVYFAGRFEALAPV